MNTLPSVYVLTKDPILQMSTIHQFSIPKVNIEEKNAMIIAKEEDPEIEQVKPEIIQQEDESLKTIFIRKHLKAVKKCCVCGRINQKHQMTVAPKGKKILKKWAEVFGQDFLETCKKDRVNHYICSIHWKQLRDDWKGTLPEVLEKMKKENNGSFEAVMALNNIDENECKQSQSKKTKLICRYCGASCFVGDMTSVPSTEATLMEWTICLGERFLENVKKHRKNKICLTHFEYHGLKQRSVYALPMPDEMINQHTNIESHICRYCGVRCMKSEMTNVPRNEKQLMKWAEILGEQFLRNVKRYDINKICWSHFERRDVYRNVNNLPMRNEIVNQTLYCEDDNSNEMENEVKTEMGIVKKEEEDEKFDGIVNNGAVYACSSHISPQDESMTFIITKKK